MLSSRAKLLLVIAWVWGAAALRFEVESTDGDVLVLDESNFDTTIAEHTKGVLVQFYAPWCGHCKKLAPEFKSAATKLMEETDGQVRLAMVDATEEKELAERFEVRGFPSLKLFRGGDPGQWTEYRGGRAAPDLVAYLKKQTGPAATLLVDGAAMVRSLAAHGPGAGRVLVGGFFADTDGFAAKLFLAAAARVDDLEFVYSPDRLLALLHPPVSAEPTDAAPPARPSARRSSRPGEAVPEGHDAVCVFSEFDERRAVLVVTSATSVDEIVAFVLAHALPRVLDFTPETSKALFSGPVKVHLLTFYDPKASEVAAALRATLAALADDHRGQVLHVLVPSTEDKVMSYFGADKKDLPQTYLADMRAEGSLRKFPFAGGKAHRLADLRAFEAAFLRGELAPHLKSEADAPAHARGPVQVLTGTTFNARCGAAATVARDCLVMFHAPWCGHCKALLPKWDALGELFAKADGAVLVAKMDATLNEIDVEGVAVKGFPTIVFFSHGGKPTTYEGGREVADLSAFLQAHATAPFELADGTKGGPRDEL